MKNLIAYIIIIILTFLITRFFYLEKNPTNPDTPKDDFCVIPRLEEAKDSVSLSIGLSEIVRSYGQYNSLKRIIKTSKEPENLPLNTLKQLFLTEGIWFEYEKFKEYISFIDKNADDANIEISGIRFFPIISDSTKGSKLTLFYNPTLKTKNNAGQEGDFSYALKKENDELIPVLLKDELGKYDFNDVNQRTDNLQKGSLFTFNLSANYNDVISQAGNRGQVTPPPSDLE